MPTIEQLNTMSDAALAEALTRCCGARRWVEGMLEARPWRDAEELLDNADAIWEELEREDWLEAFGHHPKIGDMQSLRKKFAATAAWAAGEQAGVQDAGEDTLRRLAEGNADYERRFGYIFIVCATGKSAGEMLELLESRLWNPPETELRIAAGEQAKITRIRLAKLLEHAS